MDLQFDFKGDPVGGIVTICKIPPSLSDLKDSITDPSYPLLC